MVVMETGTALSARQAAFVEQYTLDRNGTQAAIRAGYSPASAETTASRLLRNGKVRAAVDARIEKQAAKVDVTAEWVIRRLFLIAGADPNELIQHRRVACTKCIAGSEDLSVGANSLRNPDPNCAYCSGEGVGYVHVTDTTKLSDDARALYAGIKTTKDGIEIKMHDQMAALEKLGRHLGLFDPKNAVGSAENPLRMLIDSVQGSAFPIVHNPPSFDDEED